MKLNEVTSRSTHAAIESWLNKQDIKNYTIRPDGTVDVEEDVKLLSISTSIPVKFGYISGDFICYDTPITSLAGAPRSVGGLFSCSNTPITSLAGAPQSVGHAFYCHATNITSLAGAPRSVGGDFVCYETEITSLQGIHKTHRNWVVKGMLYIPEDTTHIVGLAAIRGITQVRLGGIGQVFDISHHDPLRFQDELIDAGLTQQARM